MAHAAPEEDCVGPVPDDYREQHGLEKGSKILSKLMGNKLAWVFNKPVDPKELGLDDYFDVVKTPMDLGTVRHKMRKKLYKHPDELKADIMLTFSNAMQYNPPSNAVHQWCVYFRVSRSLK